MRRIARRDANHAEIVDVFRKLGCSVLDLANVGGGCPDLLVGVHGRNIFVEVKTPRGAFTSAQLEFIESWRGTRVVVIENIEDALNLAGGKRSA